MWQGPWFSDNPKMADDEGKNLHSCKKKIIINSLNFFTFLIKRKFESNYKNIENTYQFFKKFDITFSFFGGNYQNQVCQKKTCQYIAYIALWMKTKEKEKSTLLNFKRFASFTFI